MNETLIKACEDRILDCFQICEKAFQTTFPIPTIRFELKGRRAGYARYRENLINLNYDLLIRNPEDFVKRTVGHEAAHLIAYLKFPSLSRPHGQEWASVMRLIQQEPTRCHSYEVSEVAQKSRNKWEYACVCGPNHLLGQAAHKRAQTWQKYTCRKCKQIIKFTGRIWKDS